MFKFKSFLRRVEAKEEEPPSYRRPPPTTSRNRQYGAEEPVPERRPRKRRSKGTNRKVPKHRSSGNLNRSRPDIARPPVESEVPPPELDIVTEEVREPRKRDSSSRKQRSTSRHSPKVSEQQINRSKVHEHPSPDLTQELVRLREENAALRARLDNRESIPIIQGDVQDDTFFKDSVQELQWRVFNWVKTVNWEIPNRNRSRTFIVPTVYKFLKRTCPDFKDYLSSRKDFYSLIQAHIWQYFLREVFCQPCFWAETRERSRAEQDISNNPFSLLREKLRREIAPRNEPDFQDWRVSSVRLIAKRDPKLVESNISFAARIIMIPLTENFEHIQNGDPHLRSLENIFRSAISLDYLMQQQRADYVFFPTLTGDGTVYFDEEKYELPDEDTEVVNGKTPVRLVVEPTFCKFGDSDGNNYEKEFCILKGRVDL